jgi:hypothetical protein
MNPGERKVMVVPCSGIGKTYGTVSREAAYEVTEDQRPQSTQLVALSLTRTPAPRSGPIRR